MYRWIHIALALAGLAGAMSAQLPQKKRIPTEPMERYGMPPDPMKFLAFSPGMVSSQDGYVSYQINVDGAGLNIVGDAANEPSLTIDPTNPNRMAVGWRQFNSVNSNFRQGGYAYSLDAGIHWTFPGVLQNNVFRSDPVLDTTASGVFHYNSLQQTFYTDEYRSLNQGQSWTQLGPATGGDKNWITIDKTASSGAGFIYQAWSTAGNNYDGRQFSRSTDGGTTWMDPIYLPNSPVWGTMDIGSNGELYLVGTDGGMPSLRFLRSSDAKNSAVTPTFDRSVFVDMTGDLSYGAYVNPGGLSGQAWLATDRGPSQHQGNIYILASVDVSLGDQNRIDVMFRRSTDGGQTWQSAIRVNDDGSFTNRYHWFGTLSVAPNGRVDVCWLDTRHDATSNTSRLYYTYSTDGGQTFKPNIAISQSFNSRIGWPQQNKIGDYMAMLSDNDGANIVYPATFNGEQDIYFVRVPQITTQTVTGNVNLQFVTSPAGQTSTMEFRTPSTLTVVYSAPVTLDGSGNYSVSGVPLGTYDVAMKFRSWLRQVIPNVVVSGPTSGVNFSLLCGDASVDNKVDVFDLNQVFTGFGTSGAPGFDFADLDWNGAVDTFDLNITLVNFGLVGSN